jgi:hypothetical protein
MFENEGLLFLCSRENSNKFVRSKFIDQKDTDYILPFLGQYHDAFLKDRSFEDGYVLLHFYALMKLNLIGFITFKTEDFANRDSEKEKNSIILNNIPEVNAYVENKKNNITDGHIEFKDEVFLKSHKILFDPERYNNPESLKYTLYRNIILKKNYIPLEIGYTTYCKTYAQLTRYGAIARFPYQEENLSKQTSELGILFLLDENCPIAKKNHADGKFTIIDNVG